MLEVALRHRFGRDRPWRASRRDDGFALDLAFAAPGDEFVLIEPTYDSYRPVVEATGAAVKAIKLAPPSWRLTEEVLRAAIGPKTRAILINSPHNPAGRAFSREEMETLAMVVAETDAVVICDEVYEHLVYDGRPHIPLATLPSMRERCLRIGSAGKIFSLTGWKVGWVTGPRELVGVVTKAHQFLTFTTPPALQLGVAFGVDVARPTRARQRLGPCPHVGGDRLQRHGGHHDGGDVSRVFLMWVFVKLRWFDCVVLIFRAAMAAAAARG